MKMSNFEVMQYIFLKEDVYSALCTDMTQKVGNHIMYVLMNMTEFWRIPPDSP